MKTRIALLSSACLAALISADIAAAATVGVAAAVNQSAEGTPPAGSVQTISLGDDVVHNERITTGEAGLVQLLLADGTSFTIGPSSDLTIDKFVYDPNANTAEVVATLTKGALRFLGGRAAKTNGATINAPVGVVGVRGSGADITPEFVNCTAGTCNLNGVEFPQNQSAVNTGGTVVVVATTSAMAAAASQNFQGATGTTGGTTTAVASQVTTTVTQRDESGNTTEGDAAAAPVDDTTSFFTAVNQEGETSADDFTQDASQDTPPPTPPPAGPPLTFRVLTAPDIYQTSFGAIIPGGVNDPGNDNDPAEVGLVGTDGFDQNLVTTLVEQPGNPDLFSASGDLEDGPETGPVVLPYRTATTFTVRSVALDFDPISPFGTLSGNYYLNDGFTFYELFYDSGGIDHPFYALAGTPTVFPTAFEGTQVRRYSLIDDPIQNVPVPFFRGGLINSFTGAAIGDVYVIELPDISLPDSQHVRVLQTWLQISGSGSTQQSGIGVNAGDFAPLNGDGDYGYRSGRRGSYRVDFTNPASLFYGPVNSVAGPEGGTEVFGQNGTNFILSSNVSDDDPFGDNAVNSSTHFSTVHVANLEDDDATPTAPHSDHQLFGFSAGMVEELVDDRTAAASMLSAIDAQPGFRINFEAGGNRIGGDITVNDEFDTSPQAALRLSFGGGFDLVDGGDGVYIDDDLFGGGTEGPNVNDEFDHSFATTDGGATLVYREGEFPVTYMVSSNAVDMGASPAFMGGASICECSFLEWGWWGGQPRLAASDNSDEEILRQSIHLGTWVAGDIVATHLELGALGSVSYSGHVIGTVVTVDPNESGDPSQPILTQYVAGGSVILNWGLASRTGAITIDFDGNQLGGTVSESLAGSGAYFSGDLQGTGLTGTVNGAIVRNVDHVTTTTTLLNAGIIGNFGIYGLNYAATGIMAGEVVAPTSPPVVPVALPLRVLTADAVQYTPYFSNDPILDPGQVGLVGNGSQPGEDGNDTIDNAVTYYDPDDPTPAPSSGLTLPFEFTNVSTELDVALGEAYANSDPLTGRAFFGPGQFAAYTLVFNDLGDLHPYYGVRGIPTTITPNGGTGVFEGGGIRAYELSDDVIQDVPVPFMRDVAGFDWNTWIEGTDYFETPLYVVNSHEPDDFNPHLLQTWLAISGTGATQVSGVGVSVSAIFNDDADGLGFEINAGRRGSFRNDANEGSVTMGGAYATLGNGTADANHFFGPNAENFVIGTGGYIIDENGVPVPDAFSDFSLDGGADQGRFGTMHIATLVEEDVPGIGGDRTERTLSGFVAGVVDILEESGCTGGIGQNCSYSFSQTRATGEISINFNPLRDRLGGSLTVRGDVFGEVDPASMTLGFGKIEGEAGNDGKSTFVDDDIYAARESNPTAGTPEPTFVESGGGDHYAQRENNGSNTYLVSADAVPLDTVSTPDFMGGTGDQEFCTQCDFMEWGWWGTQGRFADPNATDDSVYVATHLGTWVAGDLTEPGTDPDDLPTTGGATYDGHAVGNVTNAGASYVAGGDMDMSWNFGTRTGAWNVTDFDGKDFGGTVTDPEVSPSGFFSGDISTGDLGSTGSVGGAFANDGNIPAAGVLGSFDVNDGSNWAATGTFLGAQ